MALQRPVVGFVMGVSILCLFIQAESVTTLAMEWKNKVVIEFLDLYEAESAI